MMMMIVIVLKLEDREELYAKCSSLSTGVCDLVLIFDIEGLNFL